MNLYASLQGAVLPILLYIILLWRFDKFDREPFLLLAGNFLWGALGATAIAITVSSAITSVFKITEFYTTVAVAPVVEEISKGIILFLTIRSRKFDNLTDGLVYGGAVGCGFAMTENFIYFIAYGKTAESLIFLIIMRSLFSAVMHLVATASFGMFLSFYKFGARWTKPFYVLLALASSMSLHFLWNFEVSQGNTFPGGLFFLILALLAFIFVFSLSLKFEKKIIREMLREEVIIGTLPEAHLTILSSGSRRMDGWIDEDIRSRYIKAATNLAFRKRQLLHTHGNNKGKLISEIESSRNKIRELLHK